MALLDALGRKLPDAKLRAEAEEKLKTFMAKNHNAFQEWFNEHGPNKRPPIKFDTKSRQWIWLDVKDRNRE